MHPNPTEKEIDFVREALLEFIFLEPITATFINSSVLGK